VQVFCNVGLLARVQLLNNFKHVEQLSLTGL
jgi:hypothetical protein